MLKAFQSCELFMFMLSELKSKDVGYIVDALMRRSVYIEDTGVAIEYLNLARSMHEVGGRLRDQEYVEVKQEKSEAEQKDIAKKLMDLWQPLHPAYTRTQQHIGTTNNTATTTTVNVPVTGTNSGEVLGLKAKTDVKKPKSKAKVTRRRRKSSTK
jgi:hypothetical protein